METIHVKQGKSYDQAARNGGRPPKSWMGTNRNAVLFPAFAKMLWNEEVMPNQKKWLIWSTF